MAEKQTEEQLKARTFEIDGLTLHGVIEYLSGTFVHKQIDPVVQTLAQLKETTTKPEKTKPKPEEDVE